MKKIKYIFCFAMLVFAFSFFKVNTLNVFADTQNLDDINAPLDGELSTTEKTPEEIEQENFDKQFMSGGEILVNIDIIDENLYSALLGELNALGYSKTTLYVNSFINFTSLNLDVSKNINNIQNLKGLNKFNFKNVETLNLSGNKIKTITSEDLSSFPKLKTLDLSGNLLTKIDLSQITTLTKINLCSNKLKNINFSNIHGNIIDIDLSGNYFEKMSDISFPTRVNTINLDIISNNIIDIPDDYFEWEKLNISAGIQGFKYEKPKAIAYGDKVKVYKSNNPNLEIKVYKINGFDSLLVDTIKDSSIDGNYRFLDIGIGEFFYEYCIDGNLVYDKFDIKNSIYQKYSFNVIPKSPKYVFEYNGKTYTSIGKVTGSVKVKLSSDIGDIYYSINGKKWVKGTEIDCNEGGNYSLKIKTVYKENDKVFESEEINFMVKTSLNAHISDGLMLTIVLLFTLLLFLIVVPIVSKKYFKK